jgi:hypothetical protein
MYKCFAAGKHDGSLNRAVLSIPMACAVGRLKVKEYFIVMKPWLLHGYTVTILQCKVSKD